MFENKDKIVIIMEYASKGELYDYISERRRLSERETRHFFRQIVSAVHHCHKVRPALPQLCSQMVFMAPRDSVHIMKVTSVHSGMYGEFINQKEEDHRPPESRDNPRLTFLFVVFQSYSPCSSHLFFIQIFNFESF